MLFVAISNAQNNLLYNTTITESFFLPAGATNGHVWTCSGVNGLGFWAPFSATLPNGRCAFGSATNTITSDTSFRLFLMAGNPFLTVFADGVGGNITTGAISLKHAPNSNSVTLGTQSGLSASYSINFPTSQSGDGEFFTNNGTGNLGWSTQHFIFLKNDSLFKVGDGVSTTLQVLAKPLGGISARTPLTVFSAGDDNGNGNGTAFFVDDATKATSFLTDSVFFVMNVSGTDTILHLNVSTGIVTMPLPAFADDAAAGTAGLIVGQLYQLDGSGVVPPFNTAGVLMIKQ